MMIVLSSFPPSVLPSPSGALTCIAALCISSTLTLSYLDRLTHISFSMTISPHFVYLLLPGNGLIAHSSLSLFISQLVSASFSVCLFHCLLFL